MQHFEQDVNPFLPWAEGTFHMQKVTFGWNAAVLAKGLRKQLETASVHLTGLKKKNEAAASVQDILL